MFNESFFSQPVSEKVSYEQHQESDEAKVRKSLEEQEPGLVEHLSSEYNIEHFARYPEKVLLDMYREKDNPSTWGVVIVAKEDSNGAMYHTQALHEMHQNIGSSIQTKIVEASSVADVIELMAKLNGKFGPASYAIIDAHGHEGGFNLGKEEAQSEELADQKEMQSVETDTAIDEFSSVLAEHLLPQAGVCFVSCSTGKEEDSVAPQIAANSNLDTVAPTADTGIKSFGAKIHGRVVTFDPQYTEGSSRHTSGGSMVDVLPKAA